MKYTERPYSIEEFNDVKEKGIERTSRILDSWINSAFSTTKLSSEQINIRNNLINELKVDVKTDPSKYLKFYINTNATEPKCLQTLSEYRKTVFGHGIPKETRRNIAASADSFGREFSRKYDPNFKIRVDTKFYKGSKYFDDHFSSAGKGYWKSDVEMFARAFHCYIKDKLKEKGIRNDYLCGHADLFSTFNSQGEIINAYPTGDERSKINASFDLLIKKIKEDDLILHAGEPSKQNIKFIEVLPNEIKFESHFENSILRGTQLSLFDLEDEIEEDIISQNISLSPKKQLEKQIKMEFDNFKNNISDESEFKINFYQDLHDVLTSDYPLIDENNIYALLEEKYILESLFNFFIKYENESIDSLDETKELIVNYNKKYHKDIINVSSKEEILSDSMEVQISKNIDMNISLYLEDLYDSKGLDLFFTPYELKRNTIEYSYDEKTDSFIFQSWFGNIACACNETLTEVIGNTLLEKVKQYTAGNDTTKLDEILSKEYVNYNNYNLDLEHIQKNRLPDYLDHIIRDVCGELNYNYFDLKGSCTFFKCDELTQEVNNTNTLSEHRKINAINALKEIKQLAVGFINLSKATPEEIKSLSQQEMNDIAMNELNSFKLESSIGRRKMYKALATFSSTGYSMQNHLLLHNQCRNNNCDFNSLGSFNEWKNKKVSIKSGEKAMLIMVPVNKNYYYEYQSDGSPKSLPNTHDQREIAKYENLIKDNKGYKYTYTSFNLLPRVFSISQTTLDNDKTKEDGSLDNVTADKYLAKLKLLTNNLGLAFNNDDNKEVSIWYNLYTVGQYIINKANTTESRKAVNNSHKSIQNLLFANIIAEGLGVNSEQAVQRIQESNSLLSTNILDLSDYNVNHLYTHLKIMEPAIKLVGSTVYQNDVISTKQYQNIKDFIPDLFEINPNNNLAKIIKINNVDKLSNTGKEK